MSILVAQGFDQQPWFDFKEKYNHIFKLVTILTALSKG